MTAGAFHRLAFAEAGPNEAGKWLDALEPTISFHIDRLDDLQMAMDVSLRIMPEAFASQQWLAGICTSRQKAHAARDGNDDLCLLIPRAGASIQVRLPERRHGLDEVVLRPGEPAQLRGNEESYQAWSAGSKSQVICVPRARVVAAVGDLDEALYRGVAPSAELSLLSGYAETLSSDIGPMDENSLMKAGDMLADLLILALGPTRDAAEAARGSSRAAQIARIKADIEANLDNPDLSLDWLAQRHGRRPRAIRDLFYAFGTSFSDHVLAARLEQAHRLLSDVGLANRTITAIAYRSGFNDLSWFNQAFRRRYGMTPSDLRKMVQEAHSA